MTCILVEMRNDYTASARGTLRVLSLLLFVAGWSAVRGETVADMRDSMLDEIAADYRATAHLTGRKHLSATVRRALTDVPRHEFVPSSQAGYAYWNRPLLIGHGQTISQPYIVAIMTDLLDLQPADRVLEIGTGSGYQAAVLAEIVAAVYTIEIVEPLAHTAAERLRRLGYTNVEVRHGDGNLGWADASPFDAIIVTAGGRIPPALLEQLAPGGRMVIPVDQPDGSQMLVLVDKDADGAITQRDVLPVRFVPITGAN